MTERTTEPTTAEEREWWKRGFHSEAASDLTDRLIAHVDALLTERDAALGALDEQRNEHYSLACQRHREMKHANEKWGADSAFDCKETWCITMTDMDAQARALLAQQEVAG